MPRSNGDGQGRLAPRIKAIRRAPGGVCRRTRSRRPRDQTARHRVLRPSTPSSPMPTIANQGGAARQSGSDQLTSRPICAILILGGTLEARLAGGRAGAATFELAVTLLARRPHREAGAPASAGADRRLRRRRRVSRLISRSRTHRRADRRDASSHMRRRSSGGLCGACRRGSQACRCWALHRKPWEPMPGDRWSDAAERRRRLPRLWA